MEATVQTLVGHALGVDDWIIFRPEHGWSDASYVAERRGYRVFVKLGASSDVLQRVAEIGVAPAVLAAGEYQDLSYVIQEFVEGRFPDHGWFEPHVDEVARLFRLVHRDSLLRALVKSPAHPRPRQLRDMELTRRLVEASFPDPSGLKTASAWLARRLPSVPEDDLVPTHGDVNRKNFLITPTRIVMIDGDDIALADPLRDVGPLVWWYLPPSRWPSFLEKCGLPATPAVIERVYWWAACISLDITAGLLERGYLHLAHEFFGDLLAAVSLRSNPRHRSQEE